MTNAILYEQFQDALAAERMAWFALTATATASPERVLLQALWRRYADEVRKLSYRIDMNAHELPTPANPR